MGSFLQGSVGPNRLIIFSHIPAKDPWKYLHKAIPLRTLE
jgi:hypothetical protein